MNNVIKLQKWKVAQKRHRLSDKQVQMARELGFNPDKLGKLDNHKQEPWKTPLPQHIENLYYKRFGKDYPDLVKSINQLLEEEKLKKQKRKTELQENGSTTDNVERIKSPSAQTNIAEKVKYSDIKPKTRVILGSGDTHETILQKESHIFDEAFDFFEKECVTFSELGFVLKKIYPQYKPRRYGCKTLGAIYEKLDKYEIIQPEKKGASYFVRKK